MRRHHKIGVAIAVVGLVGISVWSAIRILEDPVADLVVQNPSPDQSPQQKVILEPEYEAPQDHHKFVGSHSCKTCHPDIYQSYFKTAMGNAANSRPQEHPLESTELSRSFSIGRGSDEAGDLKYEMEYVDNGQRHHEQMIGESGEILFDVSHEIALVLGSGTRGYSYLIERDGALYQSPITWYSQQHKVGLSPGYQLDNRRFSRQILDGCLNCHVGHVTPERENPHHFVPPFVEEFGISCERCHGPGKDHIAFHSHKTEIAATDPIVNPASLSVEHREAVCYQCHLAPEHRVLRAGRTDFDFRPGDLLSDIWIMFEKGTGVNEQSKTDAVNHVAQMRSSRCYQLSEGTFGCTSCHDPHNSPSTDTREAYYRQKCLTCHTAEAESCSLPQPVRLKQTPSDSCIDCHMPKLDATNVAHTSQTDHRILRVSDSPTTLKKKKSHSLVRYAETEANLSANEILRANILVELPELIRSQNRFRARELQQQLSQITPASSEDHIAIVALGRLADIQEHPDEAESYYLRALELNRNLEQPLQQLAILYHNRESWIDAYQMIVPLLKLDPLNANMWGRKAHICGSLGRLEEGIQAAFRSLELRPDSPQVHEWLSQTYSQLGQSANAEKHRSLAIQYSPK